MTRSLKAVALLTCSLALTAASCQPKRIATAIKPPAERLQCAAAGARPSIAAEYAIDWSRVTTVTQAQAEHLKYVASVRNREGVITGYIVRIEGQLFACSNNATWLREFFAKLPDAPTTPN